MALLYYVFTIESTVTSYSTVKSKYRFKLNKGHDMIQYDQSTCRLDSVIDAIGASLDYV